MEIIMEREIAAFALLDITQSGGYNNIVLQQTLNRYKSLSTVSKSAITQTVNGALRNLIYIDYTIGQFSKTPVDKIKPFLLSLLRISVYQIIFMDKTPDSAVVNDAVKITKSKGLEGLSGFVNGVLRNISRNKENIALPDKSHDFIEYISVKHSHPRWIIEYWLSFLDEQTVVDMCAANNTNPDVTACVNTLKSSRSTLLKCLEKEGVSSESGVLSENAVRIKGLSGIRNFSCFAKGYFHVMDESAIKVVEKSDIKPFMNILDLCAAPGGKSFYSSYFMENKGKIIACDIHEHKIELIKEGAMRLGIDIIEPCFNDAGIYKPEWQNAFDIVFVDAPCSGLGILRKKPDAKYSKSMEDVISLAAIQRGILDVAHRYVKPGGKLVYSTCTISKKENEDNVSLFLKEHNFKLTKEFTILPQEHSTDGFFAAYMIKQK